MSNYSTIGTQSIFDSLSKSWAAVKANVWLFAGFSFFYFIISTVFGFVPFLAEISSLFGFIFTASFYSAFQVYDVKQGEVDFGDFFKWSPQFGRLFLGNLLLAILAIVLVIPFVLLLVGIIGIDVFVNIANSADSLKDDPEAIWKIISGSTILIVLLAFILFVIALSLAFFAFPYVLQFTKMPIGEAIKYSLKIGRNNIGQMVLFALLAVGLSIIGLIFCGLGLLITFPLIFGTQYYFLKDMIAEKSDSDSEWNFEVQ